MFWRKTTSAAVIVAMFYLSSLEVVAADVRVLSHEEGAEVYAGVKLLGTTPLLIEDCRPGELNLSLAGGPDLAVEVPDDDRAVTVFLTIKPKAGWGVLGKTGKWLFIGGIIGGLSLLIYLGVTNKEN